MDSSMDTITDDCAELPAAGVDHKARNGTVMRPAVVTEIRCDGAGAEVHFFAENRVAEVR